MTKKVRIENADTGNYKVLVEVWMKDSEGNDVFVRSLPLDYPTFVAEEYIHTTQWLVVKENGKRED